LRIINAKLFGILSYLMLGIWVRDINCAMKVFRRDLWKTIRPRVATGALVNAEMFYRMKRKNILWKQVDVHHYPRQFGTQTGAKLSVILRMFKELWTLRKTVE
jgi:dolichol-phosphate mannosyltransferase